MATSLEDETQQPSFRQYPPSSQLADSPARHSLSRSKDRIVPSSPGPEESAGGFLQHQVSNEVPDGEIQEQNGERESVVQRGKEAVDSGDLLRVTSSQPGPSGRPGWSTQPHSQLTDEAPSTSSSRHSHRLQAEEDELDPSSPMPPPPDEEPPSIESPGTASPPLFERTNGIGRKRKTPPSPAGPPSPGASKAKLGSRPVSAHSPAKLTLTKSNGTTTSVPPPIRPWSRANSRSKPKRQKTIVDEQDSFADAAPARRERASAAISRMLSNGGPLELPPEMRGLDEVDWKSTEDGQQSEADGDEEDRRVTQGADGEEVPAAEADVEDEDQVEGSVSHTAPSGRANGGAGDTFINGESASQVVALEGPRSVQEEISGRHRIAIPGEARDYVQESSSSSGHAADTTAESLLFTPAGPTCIIQTESHRSVDDEHPASPSRQPTSSLPPLPSPPGSAQDIPLGESVLGRSRRGFTSVALSQTLPNDAAPDRNDLFSSQGDIAGSSQMSDPLGWPQFQPTQARRLVPQAKGQDSGTEPTQIVSEESHERARQVRAAKQKEEEESVQGAADNEQGQTMERIPTDTGGSAQGTQSPSNQIAPADTYEATYKTRRSNDESTQINSEATQLRSVPPQPSKSKSATSNRSPERVSEPPPNLQVAEHRQLRRRNMAHTRSAPQPALFLSAKLDEGDKALTDPIPDAVQLPNAPALELDASGSGVPHNGGEIAAPLTHGGDVAMGSPGPHEMSSSMQEAEDMLQVAARTQGTQRSHQPSASPIIRPTRGVRRRIPSSSPLRSPEQAPRQSSPITFPESDHPMDTALGSPRSQVHARPTRHQPVFEATLLNGETAPTLPKAKPAKAPTPVKTYGTRGKTSTVSPAKPPPARITRGRRSGTAKTASPAPQIAPSRRLVKRKQRDSTPADGQGAAGNQSGERGVDASGESQAGSSDPLSRPIETGRPPAEEDRMDVDVEDPPEPESPPTPQDSGDNTYRPVAKGKKATKGRTPAASGKSKHIGPRSEEGGASDSGQSGDEEDVAAEEEEEDEQPGPVVKMATRTAERRSARGAGKSGKVDSKAGDKRASMRAGPPSGAGVSGAGGAEADGLEADNEPAQTRARPSKSSAAATKPIGGRAGQSGKAAARRRIRSPTEQEQGRPGEETQTADATGHTAPGPSRPAGTRPLPSSRLSSTNFPSVSHAASAASPGPATSRKGIVSGEAAQKAPVSRPASNVSPGLLTRSKRPAPAASEVPAEIPRKVHKMRRTKTPDQSRGSGRNHQEADEPSEPESPPTPVDTTDETFRIEAKNSRGVVRAAASRQPSASSTSASGPSKAKPPVRKGRNSKLSIADDPAPPPTPPITTSQQSAVATQQDAAGERPMVLAYYKPMQCYYPGKVMARVGSGYRIEYLDDDTAIVPLSEMRKCEFKIGDRIKCHAPGMAKRSDLEVAADWECEGQISLKGKKGERAGEFDLDVIRIARATAIKLFDDRLVSADMFEDLPEEDENDELGGTSSGAALGPKIKGTNTFAGMVFLITPTDSTTESLRNAITRNAGLLCDWTDLFTKVEFGQSPQTEQGRTPFHITPTEIESGKASMKVKSMVALCYGIPCISPAFVDAALADPGCDWRPYATSPGVGVLHPSPTLQHLDPTWGTDTWSFSEARHQLRPLAGKRVVYLHLNPKMGELRDIVQVCTFGLGATSCDVIESPDDLQNVVYDILLISSADKDPKKASLPKVVSSNRRVCDVQWLKQCMISGVCLPFKLYSYTA